MKRSFATFITAAALAAVATVGAAPTATAAPAAKANHTKSSQASKNLAVEKRTVVSLVASKDTALVRAVKNVTRANLVVGEAEVLANIGSDRLGLAGLKAAALAATTVAEVRAIGTQVHQVRPEVYSVVVNGLRQSVFFQELVAANTATFSDVAAQADAKELELFDVTAVRDALAAAALANDEAAAYAAAALAKGVTLTAFGPRTERDAFTADVDAAGAALDVVEAQLLLAAELLAAMVPVVEPVV